MPGFDADIAVDVANVANDDDAVADLLPNAA